jgi:tubulysin polyketide synthase-like protein
MGAIDLLLELMNKNVLFATSGDTVRWDDKWGNLTPEYLDTLKEHKAEVLQYLKANVNIPESPVFDGTVNSKGKHLGKTAMQKIVMCQAIEHGANTRIDCIKELGWGITVTGRYINTLIRSGHISESDNGILSLNNITYQLIDKLVVSGRLRITKDGTITIGPR